MTESIIRKGWEFGNSASLDLRGKTTQGNLFPLRYNLGVSRNNYLRIEPS